MRFVRYNIAPVTTGTALKTQFLLKTIANLPASIISFWVSFAGTSTNANILCEWLTFSSDGTASALTGVTHDPRDTLTDLMTATQAASAEPTRVGLLWEGYVNPAGSYSQVFSDRDKLQVGSAARIGFSVTAASGACSCAMGCLVEY